jgi:hypothetical protein
MARLRTMAATAVAVAASTVVASPASAQPPPNDSIGGATVISALPFTDEVDTTEATTDTVELAAAQPCVDFGAPAIEKAVWYTGTSQTGGQVIVDVTASDYSAGIAVYAGPPSAATFLTCAPGVVRGAVTPGQTVYLMVFGDEIGSPGGVLRISVEAAPPPPIVEATVDEVGGVTPKTGVARVSGTVTCEGAAAFVNVSGTLRQRAGRVIIQGGFFAELDPACDGTPIPWAADVVAPLGLFKGGKATATITAVACTENFDCTEVTVTQDVRLRGG